MSIRVVITVQQGDQQFDLDVPVTATPAMLASLLGWGDVQVAMIRERNQLLKGDDPLQGKIREGDVLLFEKDLQWQG